MDLGTMIREKDDITKLNTNGTFCIREDNGLASVKENLPHWPMWKTKFTNI